MQKTRIFAIAMCGAVALPLGACSQPQDAEAPEHAVGNEEIAAPIGNGVSNDAEPVANASSDAETGPATKALVGQVTEATDGEAPPASPPPPGKVAPAAAAVERPKSFAMCATCHSTGAGEPNRIGPNLFGVVGSTAGSKAGYAYSESMKGSGITWTKAKLEEFIRAPREVVPGTKMMVNGPKDEAERRAIVDYLASME